MKFTKKFISNFQYLNLGSTSIAGRLRWRLDRGDQVSTVEQTLRLSGEDRSCRGTRSEVLRSKTHDIGFVMEDEVVSIEEWGTHDPINAMISLRQIAGEILICTSWSWGQHH
jgi:hypothetical protein